MNVWLALLVPRHVHHDIANGWFRPISGAEAGICRIVQLALIRLLGNPAVMGADAISAGHAWTTIGQLMEDERIEYLPEPAGIDAILPEIFRFPVATAKLVGMLIWRHSPSPLVSAW